MDQEGPNSIGRGMPYRTAKTWMIFLPEFTNDLGLALGDLLSRTRIHLHPMIAFAPCRVQMSFPFGVLDVGYVYD